MASRRVFIAGGSTTTFLGKGNPNFIWKKHPDFGKRENPNLRDMITSTVRDVMKSAGVTAPMVDRTYVGNFAGELFNQQGHLGAALAGADPALMYKPSMRIEGACASGGLATIAAIDAVKAGDDLCVVVGVEQQTTASARDGGLFLARAADFPRQSGIDDFTFPCLLVRPTRQPSTSSGGCASQHQHNTPARQPSTSSGGCPSMPVDVAGAACEGLRAEVPKLPRGRPQPHRRQGVRQRQQEPEGAHAQGKRAQHVPNHWDDHPRVMVS